LKPQVKDLHIDKVLTEISVAYTNADFIADQILPRVYVEKQSDKYWVFPGSFDVVDDRVRPGGIAREIEWELSTDNYFCEGHAMRGAVYDRQRLNVDEGLDLDIATAENVMAQILRNREYAAAQLVFNENTYDAALRTTLSGTAQWSNYANSDPISDIQAGKKAVAQAIGIEPNTLVLGYEVWVTLRKHTGLMTLYDSQRKRLLTIDMMRELFEIPNIVVGKAMYNTAPQGKTVTRGFIWGKHAALLYVPDRPAQKTPAFGYTFVWNGVNGVNGIVTYKYRNEDRHADIIENEFYYDHKIVVQKAGYFIEDAVA